MKNLKNTTPFCLRKYNGDYYLVPVDKVDRFDTLVKDSRMYELTEQYTSYYLTDDTIESEYEGYKASWEYLQTITFKPETHLH